MMQVSGTTDMQPQRADAGMIAIVRQAIAHHSAWLNAAIGVVAAIVFAAPALLPTDLNFILGFGQKRDQAGRSSLSGLSRAFREIAVGGYTGIPYHYPSDVRLVRPQGTDLTIRNVNWYGEPFRFPLYAGVRAIGWNGPVGFMVDFLHDKAVAQTGKGAHGSRVSGERSIVQVVETSGVLKGVPAAERTKLTDILERLEFTHGHNMILPTAMLRLGTPFPRVRLYGGIGVGAAIPHVEVWPAGEDEKSRTNEYQLSGPAVQAAVGLELQMPWGATYVEYKLTYAWLRTALTGGKTPAWCNCDFVSDFARQFVGWWRGDAPRLGMLATSLGTHQVVAGASYRLSGP